MNDAKKEQLSAFMDGELDGRDKNLVDQLLKDPELLDTWSRYHLVSDCLKQCLPDSIDRGLAGNISKSLQKEPAIVAPVRLSHPLLKPVTGFALAASVTALAILGIQQQQLGGPHETPQDTLVQTVPGVSGAGTVYAPVRQVSSGNSEIVTECIDLPAGNSQSETGKGKQAMEDSMEDTAAAVKEVNCR